MNQVLQRRWVYKVTEDHLKTVNLDGRSDRGWQRLHGSEVIYWANKLVFYIFLDLSIERESIFKKTQDQSSNWLFLQYW